MFFSITYNQIRPSAKLWTHTRQALQHLESIWGSELELRLSLQAEQRGVRVTVSGRDQKGHALGTSVIAKDILPAIDAAVSVLEQQSHWLSKRSSPTKQLRSSQGTVLS